MASIRFHEEKNLLQRIFIQTGSQEIGGSTQVTLECFFIRVQLQQKTSWNSFPAYPHWPQRTFTLRTKEDNSSLDIEA